MTSELKRKPIDPEFLRQRSEALRKIYMAFPSDVEAIEALAAMNPIAMPRLEVIDDLGNVVPNPIFRVGLRYRIVWDQYSLREVT